MSRPLQPYAQDGELGHPRGQDVPHAAPVADEVPEAAAGGHVGPEGGEAFGEHVDVDVCDGREAVGADAFGEVDEGFEVGAGLDGEGVCGVEDVGCFVVDGTAGFEQTRFAAVGLLVGFVVVPVVFVVWMIAAAAVCGPFATIVRDARLVPWMVEVDYFVAEDVNVDHAADFVWENCEKVAALGLWLGGAGKRKVSKLLGSFGKGSWNCSFGVKLSSVQYDWVHD